MRIQVHNTIEIAKSFSVKRSKIDGLPSTLACVKFAGLFIDREYSDEMLGLPIAATTLLYADDGVPVSMIAISRKQIVYEFSGAISGNKNRNEEISLNGTTHIEKSELQLVKGGALLSGRISWPVRGDEVEDLEPLLGQTCILIGHISLPEQIDAFAQATAKNREITKKISGAMQ